MEFLLDIRFEDKGYQAMVHFVATFSAKDNSEAQIFYHELIESFNRRKVVLFSSTYYRIDHDPELRDRTYEYVEFQRNRSTASIQIEQFYLENPDQTKSLIENLVENLFEGGDGTASIGRKYNIPVRVLDSKTRNPITSDFFYFTTEHLIPKSR